MDQVFRSGDLPTNKSPTQDQTTEALSRSSLLFLALHDLANEMHKFPDCDGLYHRAVVMGRSLLAFDRMGLLLLDSKREWMSGTYGTDEMGNLTDERGFRMPVPERDLLLHSSLENRDFVMVRVNQTIYHMGNAVGQGWNAVYALWDGDTPFGFISCDNLLTARPLGFFQTELLGIFGSSIASLILRKRYETNLEARVKEQTTELQATVEALLKSRRSLVEAEKISALGSLVGGVAHEMNTPLGVMVTASSALAEVLPVGSEAHELARLVLNSSQRIATLVENFKHLSVHQAGQELPRVFSLASVVDEALRAAQMTLPGALRNCLVEVPADALVFTWRDTLVEVLLRLFTNSLQAVTNVEAGCIRVTYDDSDATLRIEDNGPGLPNEVLERLFEPFVTTRRALGGVGLGLSIAHNLVEHRLSGQLRAVPGQLGGAAFQLALSYAHAWTDDFDVVLIPGLGGATGLHWMAHWERRFPPIRRVTQADWDHADQATWVEAVVATLEKGNGKPIVAICHDVGCEAFLQAATRSSANVAGAFLASPTHFHGVGRAPLPTFPLVKVVSAFDQGEPDSAVPTVVVSAEAGLGMRAELGDWLHGQKLFEALLMKALLHQAKHPA